MKKWISILLIAFMIGSVFTVVPHAEEPELAKESTASSEEQQDESVEEYIYYSDLFYEYPYYLTENGFFNAYNSDVEYIFNKVFNEYKNSPYVVGTGLEHAMDMFGSPTDIANFATSFLGISNYEANKAIDSANKKLMMELLSGSDKDNLLKTYGKIGTTVTKVKKAFNVLDTIYSYDPGNPLEGSSEGTAKERLEYYTQYYLREAYAELYNLGVLKKFNNTFISRFYTAFTDEGIRISDYFSPSIKAIDIAKSVLELIMIEDTKMELIDDIIATQSNNTLLKTGMTRLKNQLVGGSVTYFMDTYIKTKAADTICGFVDELYLDAIPSYRAISKAVKQIKNIVFSIWEVPKYDDIMTYKVLEAYSDDLYGSILTKAKIFRNAPFISDRIVEYEALFNAYIATNKLAINSLQRIADMMQPYGDVYALFEEAQQKGVANVVIEWTDSVNNLKNSLTFDAYTSEDALIQSLQSLVLFGNEFTVKNGIQTVKFSGKSIRCYLTVKEGVETIQTPLQNYADRYNNVDIYSEYTQQLKDYIGDIPVSSRIKIEKSTYENWTYTVNSNQKFKIESDIIEKNCIYAVNGFIRGNVTYSQYNPSVPDNITIGIDGNVKAVSLGYAGLDAVVLTIPKNSVLQITGSITGSTAYATYAQTTIENYGHLTVDGDWNDSIVYKGFESSIAYINGNITSTNAFDSGEVHFRGNTLANISHTDRLTSTLQAIFDGEEEQSIGIYDYIKSIDVYNPKVVLKTAIKVYDYVDFHGNDVNIQNNSVYLQGSATAIEGSNYKGITIDGTYRLRNSIKANVTCAGDLIVENGNYIIDGNFYLANTGAGYSNKAHTLTIGRGAYITINGTYNSNVGYDTTPWIYNRGQITINGNCGRIHYKGYDTSVAYLNGNITTINAFDSGEVHFRGNTLSDISRTDRITSTLQAIFDGEEEQSIGIDRYISIKGIEIKNPNGVIFKTPISPYYLFNHNGNKFTLQAGGTFVDYDGDGLKDNVDPEPAVGNPCVINIVSNDNAFGTVDTERIETIGGTKHTITATPTFKYEFIGWRNATGKTVSTATEYTFVAKTNDTLTAIFRKRLQPIVKQAVVGGKVNAPSSAEIESSVFVTVTENEGYMFTEGSLKINGETISPGSFVMPDVPVTITAEFVRNENYFALKDAIVAARRIPSMGYTNASFEQLQDAIASAQDAIRNHISETESNTLISAIDEAEQALESSCKAQISMKTDSINIIFSVEGYLYGDSDISPPPGMIIDIDEMWGASYSINGQEVQVTNYNIESKTCTLLLEGIPYNKINQPITIHMEGMDDDWDYWDFEYTLSSPLQIGAELFDANGDGGIDIRDLIHMKKLMSEMPQSQNKKLPDLDGNGDLNALDLTYLIKILLFS